MKIVLALALALAASTPVASATYEDNVAATVRVDCGFSAGTAVKIGVDRYITAAHVVDSPLCSVGGVPLTNVSVEDHDFATFTSKSSADFTKVSCKGYKTGEYYLAKGYALGGFESVSIPWLATEFIQAGYRVFMGEGVPGMSGGPLVNRRGEVVGVVNMRWPSRSVALRDTSVCKD